MGHRVNQTVIFAPNVLNEIPKAISQELIEKTPIEEFRDVVVNAAMKQIDDDILKR